MDWDNGPKHLTASVGMFGEVLRTSQICCPSCFALISIMAQEVFFLIILDFYIFILLSEAVNLYSTVIKTNQRANTSSSPACFAFIRLLFAAFTGGFRCSGFRVQLSCIQGRRVQLFAQRIEWLSIHYRSIGVKTIQLISALLRWCSLGQSRLCWGLWLRLGLLFLLGLDKEISVSDSFDKFSLFIVSVLLVQ